MKTSSPLAWYGVGVLMLANISALLDRQVISLMVAPLQRDLGIDDTQFGLLMGFGFVFFFAIGAIPLAHLADTRNRKRLIMGCIAVWSLFTAFSGMARNFGQLLTARMGVGIGEAGLTPAAISWISDQFPPQKRPVALSVFQLGKALGAGLALVIAGQVGQIAAKTQTMRLPLVGEIFSWQFIFFLLGIAGFVNILLMIPMKEATRHLATLDQNVSLRDCFRYLYLKRACIVPLFAGLCAAMAVVFGFSAWAPELLIRKLGWEPARTGAVLGASTLLFTTLGVLTGGRLARQLAARGDRLAIPRVMRLGIFLLIVPCLTFILVPGQTMTVIALGFTSFFLTFQAGIIPAAIAELTPNRMRARTMALYMVAINFIGGSLGPLLIGLLSDRVFTNHAGLTLAMAAVFLPMFLLAIGLLSQAMRHYEQSLID